MADRREISLDDQDVIAAAQILAWIALPHRPQSGVDLLCQWFWARRRHRGEQVPELPFDLKKPSRIEPQLATFRQRIMSGFRAAIWFDFRVISGPHRPPMFADIDVSIRSLARRELLPSQRGGEGDAEGNVVRDIWSRRKPFAHMASAAAHEILAMHDAAGVRGFDLEMTMFDPRWVPAAIEHSESKARVAVRTGAFEWNQLARFHRDTF